MKIINKDSVNVLIFTLREKTTISNPTYLFEFKNESTKEYKYCIMANTSTNTNRYDKFSFTEGVDNALSGSLILKGLGFWTYCVYQQSSATNLDPILANGIVERGIIRLINQSSVPTFTEHIPLPKTNIVYQPS